ncbi:glutathione S-transferase family protein [Rhodococcus sp. X156]|uniref:glutathione S-transferase family protein n=1 Tax=Rhodococcus sp. X156 TaxID=2499145 RepID=UPI0013E3FACB|nr:glutathione S-transferase family protein [Rhodococcus sp. X156]
MTGTLVLHDFALDPRCYAVRLALSVLGIDHQVRPVDVYPGGEHRGAVYRRLTPTGELPVVEHGGTVVVGTARVLQHLVQLTDHRRTWAGPGVDTWLEFSAGPLAAVYTARDTAMYTTEPFDPGAAVSALRTLDDHLALQRLQDHWVVGNRPTIADLALFPAAALSRDIGVDHDRFPALRHWMRKVKLLPGFTEMPGIPVFP